MLILNKLEIFKVYRFHTVIVKRFKWTVQSSNLFADLFGLTFPETKQFRLQNKIPPLTKSQLYSFKEFCDRIGVPQVELLNYPKLFKENPLNLERWYLQLLEGGFQVNLETLSHYRKCIHKKISFLKGCNLIPEQTNVIKNFISYLEPKPTGMLSDELTEDDTFEHVHHTILMRYLMWRLDATQDVIEKFCRMHSLSTVKSFQWLSQNFAIAEDLGFRSQKLLKYGYILGFSPRNSIAVLKDVPILPSESIRKAVLVYPRLLAVPIADYIEIYDSLKNAGIPDKTIQSNLKVFQLTPETVRMRLEEIKSVPELRVLITNPQILKLITRHSEARSRLSFIQQIKLKCASVAMLDKSPDNFNLQLREGKDINTIRDVILFIKHLLKTDSKLLEKNLKKHPYYRHVPLVEIEKSYKYLRKLEFSNSAILDAVQIILYSRSKIEEAYRKSNEILQLQEKKATPVQKLNLLLYLLEKEHHFTGNGIWNEDAKSK